MRRALALAVVGGALAILLWLKPHPGAPGLGEPVAPAEGSRHVLLFADLDESGSSCGCGEVIRLARSAGGISGVSVEEFDTRADIAAAVTRIGVRVSPTVVLLGVDGAERWRFEGESPEVVDGLRDALATLQEDEHPMAGGATR